MILLRADREFLERCQDENDDKAVDRDSFSEYDNNESATKEVRLLSNSCDRSRARVSNCYTCSQSSQSESNSSPSTLSGLAESAEDLARNEAESRTE